MKKMILGLTALVMVTCSFAQPTGGHRKGPHDGMEFKKLNLTPDQQQQMKTVNEDYRKQMQALNSNESITVKAQRDQRAALAKAHKEQVESLLTPEQKSQLAQLKAERIQKGEAMAAKRLEKLQEKLNLSEQQVATIKSNQQSTHSKLDALMKDESIERTQKREQVMALRSEMKNNIEKVLTTEQKEKWESLKKEHGDRMQSDKPRHGGKDNVK